MTSERLDELIQKYVLGIQTDSELKELSCHLEEDDAAEARRKLRMALKTDAYLEEAAAEIGRESNPREPITSLNRRLGTIGSIAAAIAVGLIGWFHDPDTTPTTAEEGVATVLRIEGKGLSGKDGQDESHTLSRGDILLEGDQLTMSEGLIELVFRDSGVHAIATAPLLLTAQSSERIFLHKGDIKLHVPPQGIGFVVETAEREITDLGTSFVVTAHPKGSQVFVLDGQIEVERKNGAPGRLMNEGEVASFNENGKLRMLSRKTDGLPELSLSSVKPGSTSLSGTILGFSSTDLPRLPTKQDLMGQRLIPLIESRYQNRDCLEGLMTGQPLRFAGIAGTYNQFAERNGLDAEAVNRAGWLAWYHGRVSPPQRGRYRFWGYADNNLLVSINGKPVFDGSRYDSALRESVKVARQDHPAWPCLNAQAGFASGPWIELDETPHQLDLLFGEKAGHLTFGILLVEQEGESYETTFWGQPKWPLFLTEAPGDSQQKELEQLRTHMENKLMGSFSIDKRALWKPEN